ncbi:flagellar hook capping protein FlgD [Paenibacillus larvae subsp. larvae]|uniref:Basal-body rod modification protein FlgD n=1 Tax=Paenibacillus larvae subsp. larvae TaxID=147375 RepID=A0A2L1UFC4_9BACL|nr:flagellar hook capping FlgD N-terminal domain-containing protein [Paenibacillus larvae]AQT83642.1 hypothetical protein B1222_03215 [Paenibacillus larvae subsp. pulvifaciens]AQZ48780.1 hypothetical protein B5S25_21580 [Paenibacillus larvae subsp. pulvifaciens]AVF26875.1 flagellar hook capping protein FlgD [Paenibacillus larvae subsp. larvae]AVF31626.1 flagellar hook capping protein FlgD [Paenibacillus larvae subsp. larvae]MCY7518516.1 flagellar hook capping protein [Paenibacillus larvae]
MADILRTAGDLKNFEVKTRDKLSVNQKSETKTMRSGGNSSLGKDDFLKILIAQLVNQNPMDPMNDKEFIAQMAQFTAVEQMTFMAEQMYDLRQSLGGASTLIGKHVSYLTVNEKQEVITKQGVVDAIIMKNGMAHVVIGKEEIPIDLITRVGDSPAPEPDPGEKPDKPGEKPDKPGEKPDKPGEKPDKPNDKTGKPEIFGADKA